MTRLTRFLAVLLPALLSGCFSPFGLLYTRTVQPLDINFTRTPALLDEGQTASGDIKILRYYVEIDWDSNAIGDIAKRHGIETIHYADREQVRILGLWVQHYVHIYGE